MSKKSEVRTRKGQLIHTFGPGAMQINKDGISIIACGLDYWYTKSGTTESLSKSLISRYIFKDSRLAKRLNVDHFRIPPNAVILDEGHKIDAPIPGIRFPYWHICSNTSCQKLIKVSAIDENEVKCGECKAPAYQARFVSCCSNGHLQDFPWVAWLNHHNQSNCTESCDLALVGTGSASVSDVKVRCKTHNSRAVSLSGIFTKDSDLQGKMTSTLEQKGIACPGYSPWLGHNHSEICDAPLVGALRQSTNIYFSKTESSILIPQLEDDSDSKNLEIEAAYEKLSTDDKELINSCGDLNHKINMLVMALSHQFSKDDVTSYLEKQNQALSVINNDIESEAEYRFQEHRKFFSEIKEGVLVTKPLSISSFDDWFTEYFSAVTQVKELTVTNALYGFDRIQSQNNRTVENYKKALRAFPNKESNWLPAVKVYGEGIFLEFKADLIKQWSKNFILNESFKKLANRANSSSLFHHLEELSPEFLLIHTFAHLLINQLIFECGYSTASLRERLYVNNANDMEMYGILIYTASGDSEGSLGGLVRMATPGTLEPIIKKAIESSNWCSSDPICREVGYDGGQGPNGMNLAACHNCALLPETSCEVYNSLLDRGAITSKDLNGSGYFDYLLIDNPIS
ncbi:DUF1998 domain-containing protein [Acinetobacter sp. ANC 4282]|nr:DUF1998 domain-containing protein [Acinetobacter terrae]